MAATNITICSGIMRSGSTWAYNVCRLLAQIRAQQLNVPHGSAYLPEDKIDVFFREQAGKVPGPTVVKVHTITPGILETLRAKRARAVCTYRDPRDCVASLMTFMNDSFDQALNRTAGLLQHFDFYRRVPNVMMVRYEEMITSTLAHVRKIAGFLEIQTTDEILSRIDALTNVEGARQTMSTLKSKPADQVAASHGHLMDLSTNLHENHIQNPTPGRWKSELTREQIEKMQATLAPWLASLNYM